MTRDRYDEKSASPGRIRPQANLSNATKASKRFQRAVSDGVNKLESNQQLVGQTGDEALSQRAIKLLTFVVPVALFFAWDVSRACFVLLGLTGIFLACLRRIDTSLSKYEKVLFSSIALFFLVALTSYLLNEVPDKSSGYVWERYTLLVLFIPVYLLFRQQRFHVEAVFWLYAVSAIVVGLLGLYDYFALGKYRATGTAQPIFFGTISLAMLAIVTSGWPIFLQRRYAGIAFLVLATVLGLCAVILSGTRASWMASPFLLLILGVFYLRRSLVRYRLVAAVAAIGFFAAAYQVPIIKDRVNSMRSDIRAILATTEDERMQISIGTSERLGMLRVGWDIFLDNPILGIGPGAFRSEIESRNERGEKYLKLTAYSDPHNQYLTTLSTHGIVGFVAILSVLGVPAYMFARRLREQGNTALLALAGLSVVVCYSIYGLALAPFERKIQLVFYAYSLALLLGTLYAPAEPPDERSGTL